MVCSYTTVGFNPLTLKARVSKGPSVQAQLSHSYKNEGPLARHGIGMENSGNIGKSSLEDSSPTRVDKKKLN